VRFRVALGSRATRRKFTVAFLCCLGTLCGITSLFAAIYPDQLKTQGWPYIATVALLSATYAALIGWPRSAYSRHLSTPHTELRYQVGDLFDQEGHLVIGFSDTFDTQTPDIISRESVQGRFLDRVYLGDVAKLDSHLSEALSDEPKIAIETHQAKPRGKRKRYAMGTVAVIGSTERLYFCCAYSRILTITWPSRVLTNCGTHCLGYGAPFVIVVSWSLYLSRWLALNWLDCRVNCLKPTSLG
jgi:hypothetical protein